LSEGSVLADKTLDFREFTFCEKLAMFIPCGNTIRMKSYCVLEKTEYGVQFILSLGAVHEIVAGNG